MRSCLVAGVTPRLQKVNNRPSGYETDMFQAGGVMPTIVTQAEMKMLAGQQEHVSPTFKPSTFNLLRLTTSRRSGARTN